MRKRRTTFSGKVYEAVPIERAGAEGVCVARIEGRVCFVKYAAPGDVADLRITREKKDFLEAVIIRLIEKSQWRQDPHCSHFGICGGCTWQHLSYPAQLELKTQQVRDALERIAKIPHPGIEPILGPTKTTFYRNKLDYTFTHWRWYLESEQGVEGLEPRGLGFHLPGRFDRVLDIGKCWHQPDPSNEIRLFVKKFTLENDWEYFDLRIQEGFLRNLTLRNSNAGQWMVLLSFFREDREKMGALNQALLREFPQIHTLINTVNPKGNETLFDLDLEVVFGPGFIEEEIGGLRFRIGPKSFFQPNPAQAGVLFSAALDMVGFDGRELVYDLYCGTGTISLLAAKRAGRVVGIESVPGAVEDARENARINGIENAFFFPGDILKEINSHFFEREGYPDVIILDPPRSGMHTGVLDRLLQSGAPKILYVSCNPATQARDLKYLDAGYRIEKVQPVDMFPHTHHVENVVLLRKKDSR